MLNSIPNLYPTGPKTELCFVGSVPGIFCRIPFCNLVLVSYVIEVSSNDIRGSFKAIFGSSKFNPWSNRDKNFCFGPYAKGTFTMLDAEPSAPRLKTFMSLNNVPNTATVLRIELW